MNLVWHKATVAKAIVERDTKQKRAIRDAFESSGRPLSTEEAFDAAQRNIDGLGIATVYRSIKTLLEDGWLTSIDVPGAGTLYELAGKAHHHHFSCTSCSRVYELDGCDADVSIALPHGFRATGHDVTIYGLCRQCPQKRIATTARKRRTATSR